MKEGDKDAGRNPAQSAGAGDPGDESEGVREAFTQLIAEIDTLREELGRNNARIRYLESLAERDSLTPVANRRAFLSELQRFTAFAERYHAPSSVICIDIDGMKRINGEFGQRAGDAVLCAVANILLANLRASDVIGRIGGDEFGVILARTDEATAERKAQALARRVAAAAVEGDGCTIPVTISWGVFALTGDADAHEVLDRAWRAANDGKAR